MGSGLLDDDRQGNMPVFAPSTPNPMKKVAPENNLVSPEAYSVACQNTFNSAQEENVDSASSRRCTDLQVDPAAQQEVRADLALSFHEEETGKMISGDPEVDAAAGLDKLNQQKPRRKKHRPKVVRENQAKRVPNPRTPQKPVDPNMPPRVKRTYVRRNKIKTPPPPSTTTPPLKERAKPLHPEVPKPTTKRTLNFDSEDLSRRDVSSSDKPNEYFQSEQAPLTGNVQDPGIQSAIEERPLECLGRNFNSPAGVDPSSGNGDSTDMLFGRKLYYNTSSIPVMLIPESCKKRRTGKISKPNKTGTYQSASDFSSNQVPSINLGTTACSNEERQYTSWADLDRLKKKRSRTAIRARDQDSLNAVCKEMPPDSFNAVCEQILPPPPKKKRKYTRKQAPKALTSLPSCSEALAGVVGKPATRRRSKPKTTPVRSRHLNFNRTNMPNSLVLYNHQQFTCDVPGTLLALPWSKMISVDDIAEKFQQLHITQKSSKQNQQSNAIIPYQGRRRKEQNALVLYRRDGTMVASYATSDQARKGKSRAKVNLDNETERVWKLLLMDINSEGIDGTDEEKAKWWEKERKTFHGRVESFIGRMNDVQGQRKFSPWKGSVVDSVVGVFLTQNVSDHLSSSAFMSMVARFPVRSDIAQRTSYAEQAAPLIEEPEDCEEVTCNDAGAARTMEGPVYDKIIHEFDICFGKELEESQDCYCAASPKDGPSQYVKITNNNEAKSDESRVYKNDKITSETQTASDLADAKTEDVTSSQQSVVSSQNSANSPSAPQVINFCQNIEDNSDVENLTLTSSSNRFERQTSFVALLTTIHQQCQSPQQNSDQGQLVGSRPDEIKHGVSRSELAHNSLVYQNVSSAAYQLQQMADNFEVPDKDIQFLGNSQRMDESCQTEYMAKVSTPRNDQDLTASSYIYGDNCLRSSLVASNLPPMDQHIEESIFSNNLTKKDERCIAKHSAGTTEPTSQPFFLEKSTERVPKCCPGTCSCYVLEGEVMVVKSIKLLVKRQQSETELPTPGQESSMERNPEVHTSFGDNVSVTQSTSISTSRECNGNQPVQLVIDHERSSHKSTDVVKKEIPTKSASKAGKEKGAAFDWDRLRREAQSRGTSHERTRNTMDSVDWEAVRCSAVSDVADTIKERGMNNVLAGRIQNFLNRLVSDHGSIDLEWLRDVPPDKAKEYLLSIRGLGLKSVECVRLLTLHHLAFPVDTNVGRIAVRLGWVPLQPLPESLQLHLLELYPVLESIQKYLWPRLCKLDQHTLYELHYHMITFGKVFCTKKQPNCNACPLRGECRHFASAFASARLSLPGPEQQSIISATQNAFTQRDSSVPMAHFPVPLPLENHLSEARYEIRSSRPMVEVPVSSEPIVEVPASPEPIVEVPASPEPDQTQSQQCDIENIFDDDPNEIPTIKLNIQQFSQNLQTYIQSMELDSRNMCNALVALTPEVASIPTPKLKNVSRLRTEHHVYELPDTHTLLERMPQREQDDPCPYLLAVWTPGETADSIQPPERRCNNEEPNQLCNDETCFYCSSLREAQSKIVRATLLIPCRTAMRGSFPLNGTYFQVNEVFADHDSSLNPMNVPRGLIWNLPRRTVYFGTSIPTIFRGLSTIEIQQCFYKGYVCVRGFDQKTRAPKPLKARLHFPASKKTRSRGKNVQED